MSEYTATCYPNKTLSPSYLYRVFCDEQYISDEMDVYKTIKRLCVIVLSLLVCMPVLALAEENSCIFFAPQSMNETNEIIVPVYTKKLAQNNDGLCGCEFQFAYNTEQFTLCGTELIMNSGEQLKGQDIKLGIYARTTLP